MINNNTYHCYMLCDMEKTGDWVMTTSRLSAAKYFAKKKNISLKEWLKIYTAFSKSTYSINEMKGHSIIISKAKDMIVFKCSNKAPFKIVRKFGNFHFEGKKDVYTMRQFMDLLSGLDKFYLVEVDDMKIK